MLGFFNHRYLAILSLNSPYCNPSEPEEERFPILSLGSAPFVKNMLSGTFIHLCLMSRLDLVKTAGDEKSRQRYK